MKRKNLAILGSTGSIGINTLEIVRRYKKCFNVVALAVHTNIKLLKQQIKEFSPKIVCVFDENKAKEIRKDVDIDVVSSMEGMIEIVSHPDVDKVVCAISGTAGIIPTVYALKQKKSIALANKEALVSAGDLIMQLAEKNQVTIVPIDSEHSALFQLMQGKEKKDVSRLILTASGGPFFHYDDEQMKCVTVEEALNHPTWPMGLKNTVDSSTMMNKGLEVIEAHFLFKMPLNVIEVVIHPQSLIHSFIETIDGAVSSILYSPSMLVPIQYALSYPDKLSSPLRPFDFTRSHKLDFYPVDKRRFSCLGLAYEAIRIGKSMPCFINAANEILVKRFLSQEIRWHEIAIKLERLMSSHTARNMVSLEAILNIDEEAKEKALQI